ncbi:unnamed protein product [Musa textilis]
MLVGLSTQLLVNLCEVKGVVHFGIAGNANPDLQIGYVTIPQCWAQTGLWYGQVFLLPPCDLDGPDDELSLESNGDHTRKIWYLNFSDYNSVSSEEKSSGNTLNSVWYQPEEAFPVNGVPETRQHAFWVSVGKHYHELSKKLEVMHPWHEATNYHSALTLQVVKRVAKGCGAKAFVDKAAYRQFLRSKFGVLLQLTWRVQLQHLCALSNRSLSKPSGLSLIWLVEALPSPMKLRFLDRWQQKMLYSSPLNSSPH